MGEPGHCAYTVRVARGQWKPAYSLSWKRGVHVRFYDSGSFNLLVLTEAVFSDDESLQNAYTRLWQARAAYLQAIKVQPINYEIWQSYGNWLNGQKGNTLKYWKAFHLEAIKSYASYPEVAWMLVSIISHKQSQRKKRDGFLNQAKKQEGVKKAETLYLAVETDAGLRKEALKQLKACDPENKSGYLSLLEFNGRGAIGHANKLAGEKKFDEALAWLDEQASQPKLNTEQKQWILAAKGNVYRRWDGHLKEMNQAFRAAHELDPDSVVGKACLRLAEKFYKQPLL